MSALKEIFDSFKNKTVLVIGDVMIDSYVYGGPQKISTDAPVPIVNATKREKRLGGAANVALNIQALGATPILCSVVGDDLDGETFERLLEYQGMPNKGIIRSQNRVTTNKLRILSGHQQLLRVDSEDDHPLVDLDRKSLLHHIDNLSKECDLIIFEDYDKGTIHSEVISETIRIAKDRKIPVAADPKQQNFLSYQGVDLFKPTLAELESINEDGVDLRLPSNLNKVMGKLNDKIKADRYVLSLHDGDIFYYAGESNGILKTNHKGISDMSGVGNSIISIAGLCMTLGLSPEIIAEMSNIGASIVAGHSGVVPIEKEQLFKAAEKSQILAKYL